MTSSSETITERAIRKHKKFVGRKTFFSSSLYFLSAYQQSSKNLLNYEDTEKSLSDEALDKAKDEIYTLLREIGVKNDVRRHRLE